MPCNKCDDLRTQYNAALEELRKMLADFEQSSPTMEEVEKIEERRLALDRALRAFLAHVSDHGRL